MKSKLKQFSLLAIAVTMGLASLSAHATAIDLFEWIVNVDGTVADSYFGDPVPSEVNIAGFNTTTGLGTVTVSLSGAGSHYVGLWVDHEIDQTLNGFTNETGSTTGSPTMGQTWELGDPLAIGGTWDNIYAGTLNNTNDSTAAGDVSMALGWDYILGALDTSSVSFTVSDIAPASGFYLTQFDPDSQASIYFSSALTIRPNNGTAPEPATVLLLGAGLAAFGVRRRRG